MVDTISIRNFRSFNDVKIEGLRRINILVGENGSGKTALLEGLFLAGGVSPELANRTRGWRGAELQNFQGTREDVNEALWGDLFHRFQWNRSAVIALRGKGDETRTVTISLNPRGKQVAIPPPRNKSGAPVRVVEEKAPIVFKWKVQTFPDVTVRPRIEDGKMVFGEVSERYVRASFFAANRVAPPVEVANRFSKLSKHFEEAWLLEQFSSLYPRIRSLSVEMSAGSPMLYATVSDLPEKIPLTMASGGANKVAAILLAIAEQRDGYVIIDELENGLYHPHLSKVWEVLLNCSMKYDCQLFISTHSLECLQAAAGHAEKAPGDFSVIRTVLDGGETRVRCFSGDKFVAAMQEEIDIR